MVPRPCRLTDPPPDYSAASIKHSWDIRPSAERTSFACARLRAKCHLCETPLEETGMGYALEVEMIREAHALGLLTCPYVFTPDEAAAMAEAGADVLVPHMGLTTKGSIGARTAMTLEEAVPRVQAMADAAHAVRPDVLVLCHGGPIAEPEDARYVLTRTRGVVGFFGASSIERLPVETAIAEQTRRFKDIPLGAGR